ncbi:MAG: hypothetical protein ABIF17_02690 [Patescibacteria group bacterium]
MSIYRAVFRNALKITWQFKYLWFFGIFAALVGNVGEFNLALDNFPRISANGSFLEILRSTYQQGWLGNSWYNFKELIGSFHLFGSIIVLILIAFVLFLVWLSIVCQGGLFSTAYKIFKKKKASFTESFAVGKENFWSVLWLNVLFKIFIVILWVIFGLPLILLYLSRGAQGIQALFVLVSFIVLLPITIVFSFIIKYAILYVVTGKTKIKEAIVKAWNLFIKNWLVSLEVAIIIFALSIVFVVAVFLVITLVFLPFSFLIDVTSGANMAGLAYSIFIIAIAVLVLLILWMGAMWSVFVHTAWAILFARISEGQVIAKLVRMFHGDTQIE